MCSGECSFTESIEIQCCPSFAQDKPWLAKLSNYRPITILDTLSNLKGSIIPLSPFMVLVDRPKLVFSCIRT